MSGGGEGMAGELQEEKGWRVSCRRRRNGGLELRRRKDGG